MCSRTKGKQMKALALSVVLLLSGCSNFDGKDFVFPSFWDDNESSKMIDIQTTIMWLDCESTDVREQIELISYEIDWFKNYAKSKGSKDVLRLIVDLETTVDGMVEKESWSPAYCNLKHSIMLNQSEMVSEAVMRRF